MTQDGVHCTVCLREYEDTDALRMCNRCLMGGCRECATIEQCGQCLLFSCSSCGNWSPQGHCEECWTDEAELWETWQPTATEDDEGNQSDDSISSLSSSPSIDEL